MSSSSEGDLVILRGDAKKGGSDPRNVGEDHKKPCEDLRLVTSFLDIVRGLPQNMRAGGGDRSGRQICRPLRGLVHRTLSSPG